MRINLKKADFSDIEFLWYLRNQPDVYKYAHQNRPVSWKEHINWIFPVILRIDNKELFVVRNQQIPIGQIRFDYNNQKEAIVTISILKEFRGKGFAVKSLKMAIREIKRQKNVKRLIAEIHKGNLVSIKFFEKLNFKFQKRKGNYLNYTLNLWSKK